MSTFEEQMDAARKKAAKLSVGPDGRDARPSLLLWCAAAMHMKEGPFLLDALTATAVMQDAHMIWTIGGMAGLEPNPTVIGKVLRRLGCRVWRPDRCKLWIVRNDDEVRLKGGAYWLARAKHVEHGGTPDWEPDPLYRKKSRPVPSRSRGGLRG